MLPVYDNIGKKYTNVISKVPVLVEIRLANGDWIMGNLHVKPAIRLKDEINHEDKFLAITVAKVNHGQGYQTHVYQILLVNSDQIAWINPIQENTRDGTE